MSEITALTDRELYERCQKYGSQARIWKQRFCGLLPEVARRNLYHRKGFYSIYDFAAKVGGIGAETVNRILQISKKLEDKPELLHLLESGEQGWSKIAQVAYLATPETDKDLADKVNNLSKSALTAYVENIRVESVPGNTSQPEIFHNMSFQVSDQVEKDLRILKYELEKDRGHPLMFNEVIRELTLKTPQPQIILKVCPECAKKKGAEAQTRHMPAIVNKVIQARYKNTCGFRGCNLPATSLHHTARYALNPSHDPDGIVPLCDKHERFVHSSLILNEEDSPEAWEVTGQPEKNAKYFIDKKVQAFRDRRTPPETSSISVEDD